MDFEILKPFLLDFICYYYTDLNNLTGGNLHAALDDGNLDDGYLWTCQESALNTGDTFGYFLATLLRHFNTNELELMYQNNHWGMEK